MPDIEERLGDKRHLIEHAISMYANDFVLISANLMYDQDSAEQYKDLISKCHIYFIGEVPKIKIGEIKKENNSLLIDVSLYGGKNKGTLNLDLPENFKLIQENEDVYLEDDIGEKYDAIPERIAFLNAISRSIQNLNFKVQYIGQAYGKDGNRNALDRLKSHSTLQEMAIKGVSEGHDLQLLLIGLENNKLYTFMNPFAKNKDKDTSSKRISNGLDMLFNTTEKERVSLYEAAMIRYFQPQYNKQLKDSFPSTDIKTLSNCYDKDMQGVIAEFGLEGFPFNLYSETIPPKDYHIARFDLHNEDDRKVFFSG